MALPDSGGRHWLGTDDRGFDCLARVVYGARITLTVGMVATALSLLIGVIVGAVSGFFLGWVDLFLQRAVEIMMTFPTFVFLLVIVSMLGRDILLIMTVIGLTGWAGVARLVRGEFLVQSGREYVLAGRVLGYSNTRLMFRHILPNSATPLLINAAFAIAGAILVESTLAFLGLGDPLAPSWGAQLDVGRRNLHYIWLIWVPGTMIFVVVMALNLIGDALREAVDAKGGAE
jgi:peptide/nickel transport system permease protein